MENNQRLHNSYLDAYVKKITHLVLKVLLFLLYLIRWVPTRTILLLILVVDWFLAIFIIEPILRVWFLYMNIEDSRNRVQIRRTVSRMTTAVSQISVSLLVFILLMTLLYRNGINSLFKYKDSQSSYSSGQDLKNWTAVIEDYKRIWVDIEKSKQKIDLQIQHFDNYLNKVDTEQIWNDLQSKQKQIEYIRETIDQDIRDTINNESHTMNGEDASSLDTLSKLIAEVLHTQKTEEMIQTALNKYHHDVLNRADFALKSRRARIIYSLTSATYSKAPVWKQSIFQFLGMINSENTPDLAITPQTHSGECWTMYGNNGTLGIKLSQIITIESITIEYPSSEVMSGYMENAPKEIELFGITADFPKKSVSLGKIEYDIYGDFTIQTFDLNTTTTYQTQPFGIVQVQIHSNWGSLEHTDIYRIRIHGTPTIK